MTKKKEENQPAEEHNEKKFVYAKAYVQEKLENGDTPSLPKPLFRNSYKKEEVNYEKPKINGVLADVNFNENYNNDGYDVSLLMVCKDAYVKVTFPCERVLGTQLLKRISGIDLERNVVLELWKNDKGYANLAVYQRDPNNLSENGVPAKEFVRDQFKDDENLPEPQTVKVGKQVVRDNSERTDYLIEKIKEWKENNKQLEKNLQLVTYSPKSEDDGNDDCE